MSKLLKKSFIILSAFICIFLTSCTNKNTGDNVSQESISQKLENTEEIRVGILSIDDVLPIVVADEEDLFSKANLNVKIYPFKSSIDQSKAMEAGELDIVMNDMIVQGLMKKAGLDTKVISYAFGADKSEGRFVVVSAPNSDIKEPEDLYGKKLAISNNTMMDYLMYQYEGNLSLDSSKIEKVNIPDLLLRMEMLLEGKEIDAAILPDPLASFAISKGCHPVIDDTLLSENFSQSVILARNEFIENNKNDLEKFMEVYFNTMEEINKNPEKYKEIAIKNARVADDIKDTCQTPKFSPYKVPGKEDVKRVTDWLLEKNLIDTEYSYEELVDTDFIDKK